MTQVPIGRLESERDVGPLCATAACPAAVTLNPTAWPPWTHEDGPPIPDELQP